MIRNAKIQPKKFSSQNFPQFFSKAIFINSLFLIFSNPLFYIVNTLEVLLANFLFFFINRFFIFGEGVNSLQFFWNFFSYSAIFSVPILTFSTCKILKDESLAHNFFCRFFSIQISHFFSTILMIFPLIFTPICVNFFYNADFSIFFAGFFGFLFFRFAIFSLCISIFSIFENSAIQFFLSAFLISFSIFQKFFHYFFPIPIFLQNAFQFFSLSKNFFPFTMGIIDFSSLAFFIFFASVFFALAFFFQKIKCGNFLSAKKIALTIIFFALFCKSTSIITLKFDATKNHIWSVSNPTLKIFSCAKTALNITYYFSPELNSYSIQSKFIYDYLDFFSKTISKKTGKKIILSRKKVDPQIEKSLLEHGIKSVLLKKTEKNKTQNIRAFSAITLEYFDRTETIPLALSLENLEYDLAVRARFLILGEKPQILIFCADENQEENFSHIATWLLNRFFSVEKITKQNFFSLFEDFNANELSAFFSQKNLLVLNAKSLLPNEIQIIQSAKNFGCNIFLSFSPFFCDIYGAWNILQAKNDFLEQFLEENGIIFENSIVCDTNCSKIILQNPENDIDLKTLDFPVWIFASSQKNAPRGANFFWASPIIQNEKIEILAFSSENSSKIPQKIDQKQNPDFLKLSNPFDLSKIFLDEKKSRFPLAAKTKNQTFGNLTVFSSNLFFDLAQENFLQAVFPERTFSNLDFLVAQIFRSDGTFEIAELIEKNANNIFLQKNLSEGDFIFLRAKTIFFCFALPLFLSVGFAFCFWLFRKKIGFLIFFKRQNHFFCANFTLKHFFLFFYTLFFLHIFFSWIFHAQISEKSFSSALFNPKYENEIFKITIENKNEKLLIEKKGEFFLLQEFNGEKRKALASKTKIFSAIKSLSKTRKIALKTKHAKKNSEDFTKNFTKISIFDKNGNTLCALHLKNEAGIVKKISFASEMAKNFSTYESEDFFPFLTCDFDFWANREIFSTLKNQEFSETFSKIVCEFEKNLPKQKTIFREDGFGRTMKIDFYEKDSETFLGAAKTFPSIADDFETAEFLRSFEYFFEISKFSAENFP